MKGIVKIKDTKTGDITDLSYTQSFDKKVFDTSDKPLQKLAYDYFVLYFKPFHEYEVILVTVTDD